ncbi:MAG: hypothetical protein Q9202_006736 [Teloschistes flavicans]
MLDFGICAALPDTHPQRTTSTAPHHLLLHPSSSLAQRTHDDTPPLHLLLARGGGGYNLRSSSLHHPLKLGTFSLQTSVVRTFSTIIPAHAAARYIEDFLDIIALRIETGAWAADNTAATHHRVLDIWCFELSFLARDEKGGGVVVPWEMVQAYVIDLAGDVGRGFVGAFEESLTGVINGVAAVVSVRLKMVAAPGGRNDPIILT